MAAFAKSWRGSASGRPTLLVARARFVEFSSISSHEHPARDSLPESHTSGICAPLLQLLQGDRNCLCELGDRAMWIVMYVALIASLSAMGMVPVTEYGDQLPHDDA